MFALAIVFLPLGQWLRIPLEQRFPRFVASDRPVAGIILLGGSERPTLTRDYGTAQIGPHAETLGTFLALARRYPGARLIFTGGSGDPLHQDVNEADVVRLYLQEQGFDPRRVLFESRSRTTFENARLSKPLAGAAIDGTWLLVQSAVAIPRAVGVFRAEGWKVIAVPVSFGAAPEVRWSPQLHLAHAFVGLDETLHEWVGLASYRATGKTEVLFPAP